MSGSNIDFPLSKTVISNKVAKEKINEPFNQLTTSEEKFDSEKIKRIYTDLFYQISKKGKKSHISVIEQSTDYVFPEVNKNLEYSITAKEEELLELNDTYLEVSLPQIEPMHPIYDNGFFVQQGTTFPDEPNSDIWYIQQGMKRKIGRNAAGNVGGYWVRLLRQADGEEVYDQYESYKSLKNSPNFRYLTDIELNNIPDGEDINNGYDLNINPLKGKEPQYVYSEIKIELTCEGVERFHKFRYGQPGFDYDLSGYPETGGYWYLDTNGYCEVRVERDIDPTSIFKRQIQDFQIEAGTSKTITISRDDKFYNHEINGTNNPLDPEFYQPNIEEVSELAKSAPNGPPMKIWKKDGFEKLFPAITNVTPGSRIKYRLKSPYNNQGIIVDGGESNYLRGIIDDDIANVEEQVDILNSFYNKDSNYETQMINNSCYGPLNAFGCYGKLDQKSDVQRIFSDPTSNYYKKSVSVEYHSGNIGLTGKVYGQPIIKVDDDLCVFIGAYSYYGGTIDYNVFYDLKNDSFKRLKNKELDDEDNYGRNRVVGYERNSTALFNWISIENNPNHSNYGTDEAKLNNPTLFFPGLQGSPINSENTDLDPSPSTGLFGSLFASWISLFQFLEGMNSDDNPFNPKATGSNYELKQEIKKHLKLG